MEFVLQTTDFNIFGDSWLYDLDPTEPDFCSCKPPPPPECTDEEEAAARAICEALIHPLSAFKVLIPIMSTTVTRLFFNDSCMDDLVGRH